MSVGLLDINVLIALAWPSHVHHARAHDWFSRHARDGWATCPLTQLGFVRISCNPKIIPDAVTPRQALAALGQIVDHEHHIFWSDEISLSSESFFAAYIMGHRQLTDAYLLSLAIHKRGKLVTLDESIPALLPAKDPRQRSIDLVSG